MLLAGLFNQDGRRRKTHGGTVRPLSLASRRTTAALTVFAVLAGLVVAVSVASLSSTPLRASATSPGAPGVPQAPTIIYAENFENGVGTTPVLLGAYVGAGSQAVTYGSDAPWANPAFCNGIIISNRSQDNPNCSGGMHVAAALNIRQLAYALGVVGGTDPSTNHAVTAYTDNEKFFPSSDPRNNIGDNLIEFQTKKNIVFAPVSGRFLTISVDAAETNCVRNNGNPENATAQMVFEMTATNGVTQLYTSPIDPCNDPSARIIAAPTEGSVHSNTSFAGTYYANSPVLYTGSSLGITMRNLTGQGGGNDAAFDNIKVVDVTPQLDKSFSPSSISAGSTSTLTLTVTNTADLKPKTPFSFTDNLPTGLTLASSPDASTTCGTGSVSAVPLGNSLALAGGGLALDQVSCTVSVKVTSGTVGQYVNGPANITSIGLNPPSNVTLAVTAAPVAALSTIKTVSTVNGAAANTSTIVKPGDLITYNLATTNSGGAPGTTTLHDAVPANTTYASTSEGWSCLTGAVAGTDCTQTITVAQGGTVTRQYTVLVNAQLNGGASHVVNVATGSSCSTACSPPPNPIVIPATLNTVKSLATVNGIPATATTVVRSGDQLTYRLVTTNSGGQSGSTTINDSVPANTTYTGTGEGWSCASGSGAGSPCSQNTSVPFGSSTTLFYTVTVSANIPVGETSIANQATASSCSTACSPTPNPLPPAALSTVKILESVNGIPATAATTVKAGDRLTYRLTTTNTGSGIGSTTITDPVPANTTYSDVYEGWSCAAGSPAGTPCRTTLTVQAGLPLSVVYSVNVVSPVPAGVTSIGNFATGSTCHDSDCAPTPNPLASFRITKTADTTAVKPGHIVRYTVIVSNTGGTAYTAAAPASFTDDFSNLLDDAVYNNDATGGATYSAPSMLWAGALPVNGSAVITYSVTVRDPDTGDHVIRNTVVSPGNSGCFAASSNPACSVLTLVQSYSVSKTSDRTTITAGSTIRYTVTVANTGQVAYTTASPASFTDDLTDLLGNANFNGDATNGALYSTPVLSWSGALNIDAVVVVTYSATVKNPTSGNHLLRNTVVTPGEGGCATGSTKAECSSLVPIQSFSTTKTASGTTAKIGQKVTYTIAVTNTGQTAYTAAAPLTFTDNLSGVLDDAVYNSDASDGATYAEPSLSWALALPIGHTVSVTYSVTVGASGGTPAASGDNLLENTVITPAEGGCAAASKDPDCSAEVKVQSFSVKKSVSAPTVKAGGTIDYTITVTNTGAVAYTAAAKASLSDDLTAVLDDAVYNNDAHHTGSGTVGYLAPSLAWSGPLVVGGSAVISYSVTVKNPATGDHRLTNTVVTPSDGGCAAPAPACAAVSLVQEYSVSKASSAPTAKAGSVIGYTVTVKNVGLVAYPSGSPASFTDDLADVLRDSVYNGDATSGATYSTPKLNWHGSLAVGQSIAVSYSVTVNAARAISSAGTDRTLTNTVATPPDGGCSDGVSASVCTVDVAIQSYSAVKTVGAETVKAGATVMYKVTVTNTGLVAYSATDRATFTDDLSAVLDDAVYNNDANAGATYSAPALAWSQPLAVGQSVVVSYSVTVRNPDLGDHTLENAVVTGPDGSCAAPSSAVPSSAAVPVAGCSAVTPVQSFSVQKSANTTSVKAGSKVIYTIVIANTGKVAYTAESPASFTDDLTNVLGKADYNNDATRGARYSAPVVSWRGGLGVGDTISLTYSITVKTPAVGDHLLVNTVVSPAEGGCLAAGGSSGCTVTVQIQSYEIKKTADVASAKLGSTVTYSITVMNTGLIAYTVAEPATFVDNLDGVLDDARYNNDVTNGATYSARALSWSGSLPVGAKKTIVYSVTISNPGTGDYSLENRVLTPPDGGCFSAPKADNCSVVTPVQAFATLKTAGASTAQAGSSVQYTITVTNVGKVAYTQADKATISDDLTNLLDDGFYNRDATNGAIYTAPKLAWSGPLGINQSLTITYSITVDNPDRGDHRLKNGVTTPAEGGCGANDSGYPAESNACTVETPVRSFSLAKTADVSAVKAGGVVTYTIAIANTGLVDYTDTAPAIFTDDLSGVLDDAVYNGDGVQIGGNIETGAANATPVYNGRSLKWSVALLVGARATFTYSVSVNATDSGDHLLRNAVVTAGEGTCPPGARLTETAQVPEDASCRTETPVQSFNTVKTASSKTVLIGSKLTYSVTLINTGQVDYTAAAPASFIDNLSNVLTGARYSGDATGGALYVGGILSWSGALDVGQTVTVTYSVIATYQQNANRQLQNAVVTPVEGGCSSEPKVSVVPPQTDKESDNKQPDNKQPDEAFAPMIPTCQVLTEVIGAYLPVVSA